MQAQFPEGTFARIEAGLETRHDVRATIQRGVSPILGRIVDVRELESGHVTPSALIEDGDICGQATRVMRKFGVSKSWVDRRWIWALEIDTIHLDDLV
jgi:hypothetical protein